MNDRINNLWLSSSGIKKMESILIMKRTILVSSKQLTSPDEDSQ